MTTPTQQHQPSMMDRLPDEILQYVLDYAMLRDSPFQIDKEPSEVEEEEVFRFNRGLIVLRSSTGDTDPLSIPTRLWSESPPHNRSRQEDHVADWLTVRAVSRRIRRLAPASFFGAKTIAMHSATALQLHTASIITSNGRSSSSSMIKDLDPNGAASEPTEVAATAGFSTAASNPRYAQYGFLRRLQAGILQIGHSAKEEEEALLGTIVHCIHDLVLVDAKLHTPSWMLRLPRVLACFSALRRATLLFGHITPEWATAAVAVGGPVPPELRALLVDLGVSSALELAEALGPDSERWEEHGKELKKTVYPVLQFKAQRIQSKKKRDAEKERTVDVEMR